MVGGEEKSSALTSQRPKVLEEGKKSLPGQAHPGAIPDLASLKPLVNQSCRASQQRKARLRAIHLANPAAESRWIRDPISILYRRRRLFPGTVINEAPLQRLAPGHQAVMRIGQ